jgi:hypothetical protein
MPFYAQAFPFFLRVFSLKITYCSPFRKHFNAGGIAD